MTTCRPAQSPLQGVLFDMDGLLVDSEPLWFEAEHAVMARLGVCWTPADQRALLGRSLDYSVSYMLGKLRSDSVPGRPPAPRQAGG